MIFDATLDKSAGYVDALARILFVTVNGRIKSTGKDRHDCIQDEPRSTGRQTRERDTLQQAVRIRQTFQIDVESAFSRIPRAMAGSRAKRPCYSFSLQS